MKKTFRVENIVNSSIYTVLLFLVSFVFVTLFSRATSFLYVFEGADPAIFKQMGLALLKGKTLYVDYFDNKGCILYFIQALGLWLGGDFFILLLQALSLTVTLVIWDKMFILYQENGKKRIVYLGLTLVLLLGFYDGGDMTEEWCLPFASYPLLVYFRSLKENKEIRPIEMFVTGVCFGIIAFIRINNAAPFLGFIAYLFIIWLLRTDFKSLFKNLILFLLGTIVIVFGCTLYFYLKAGWIGINEMYYAIFFSNLEYIQNTIHRKTFLYVFYFLFLSLCIIQQTINSRHNKEILIPSLISYGLFIVASGSRCYTHYMMTLLPLIVVLLMTIPQYNKKKKQPILIALSLVAIFFYLPVSVGLVVNDLILRNDKYTEIYNDFHHCIETIPENERDSICNYNLLGHGYGLMMHEKLLQSNRICISNTSVNMPTLWKKTSDKVKKPKWILLSWDYYFTNEDAWYIVEKYDLYCEFRYDRIYLEKPRIGQDFQVYLYRRKD